MLVEKRRTVEITDRTRISFSLVEIEEALLQHLQERPPGKVRFEWDYSRDYLEGVVIIIEDVAIEETP